MKRQSKLKFFSVLFAIILLCVLSFTGISSNGKEIVKNAFDIRKGIDIQGGVSAKLQPKIGTETGASLSQDLDALRKMIEDRLDRQNILDRMVSVDKTNGRVIVEFPWGSEGQKQNPEEFVQDAVKTAKMTFQEVTQPTADETTAFKALEGDTSKLTAKEIAKYKKTLGTTKFAYDQSPTPVLYKLVGNVLLEGKDVASAAYENNTTATNASEKAAVALKFNENGTKLFGDATGLVAKNKTQLGILMDGVIISAPTAKARIDGGSATISGNMDVTEATELAERINAGSLPFDVQVVDIQTISSSIGNSAYTIMLWSILIALILVMIFMIIIYRLPGIVASIALIAHTSIMLIFLSNFGITVTLPGMAGIILTIGMGVDANVIVFERIKEELQRGKTLTAAVNVGFKRAFTAIFDGNITSLIAGSVLYYFGTGAIKSFAITLILGVALSFLTAVTASRLMLQGITQYSVAKYHWLYASSFKKEVKEGE